MSWFRRKSKKKIISKAGTFDSYFDLRNARVKQPWKEETDSDLLEYYKSITLVHECIDLLSTTVSEPQLLHYINGKPVDDEITKLFLNPNPINSYSDFMKIYVQSYFMFGRIIVWVIKKGNKIVELWPIPNDWVENESGNYYQLNNGQIKEILKEECIEQKFIMPGTLTAYYSPLHAAGHSVQITQKLEETLMYLLDNLDFPSIHLHLEDGLSPEQIEDLKARLRDRRAGDPVITTGSGAKAENLNGLQSADFSKLLEIFKYTQPNICGIFGIPSLLIESYAGLDPATYNNKKEARRTFYQTTMVNLWKSISDTLTFSLLDDESEIKFSLDEIEYLKAEEPQK